MKYEAFISYRHSELDLYAAKQIHKKLETFKIPRSVSGKSGKKKIERVFRDQEELPIGSDLADNIRQALSDSEYLIVICSPRTPESFWVQKEIDTFIEMHGREHILAVLVEGEPAASFPKQLLTGENGEPVEPLAADIRGRSKGEMNKKMQTEIVRLAASLIGCNYDDLRQRHRERRLKKIIFASAVIAALAVAFGGYSVYNAMMIQKNYEGKQINQSKYLADTALSLLEDGDRITAGLIALEALPTGEHDRPYVASAQYALSETLNAYENGNTLEKDCLLKHDLPVKDIAYNQTGTKLVSIDQGGYVYVWDVENRTLLIKVSPEIDSMGYVVETLNAMITKEDQLVIVTKNKIHSLDLEGNELWKRDTEENYISCAFDLEEEIAAAISNEAVDFFDATDGSQIGGMENTSENSSFSSEAIFNAAHDKFAVVHFPENQNAENGTVSIYDFKTSAKAEYVTKGAYIIEQAFCADGNLIVLSGSIQAFYSYSEKMECAIEKIDISTHNSIWSNSITMKLWDWEATSAILKCRNYIDENTDAKHDEVMLTVDNMIYTWDAASGEIVSEMGVTCGISAFWVSANSGLGLVVESDGGLNFFNLTEGQNYSNTTVDIGRTIKNILVKNGVLAASTAYSPDIMILKYHEGSGLQEINEFSASVMGIDYSADESYYVIKTGNGSEGVVYYFYNTEDGTLAEEWSPQNENDALETRFISESIYMIVDRMGNIVFYDITEQEETVLEPENTMMNVCYSLSRNNKYIFLCSMDNYCVVDLQNQKVAEQGTLEKTVTGGVISEDGSVFFGSTRDTDLICIDTATGEYSSVDIEGYSTAANNDDKSAFAISSDGGLLAVSCLDNKLRILDTKKMKTVDEIDFSGQNRCFVCFSDDGSQLIMQGDTYYFRVYDVKKHKFLYVSKTQNNMIQDIIFDDASDTICLITSMEMLILNEADYEPLAYIEDGLTYMPKNALVFNQYAHMVYCFPYMTLEMLIQEAQEQFGEVSLTERERTQYNVD